MTNREVQYPIQKYVGTEVRTDRVSVEEEVNQVDVIDQVDTFLKTKKTGDSSVGVYDKPITLKDVTPLEEHLSTLFTKMSEAPGRKNSLEHRDLSLQLLQYEHGQAVLPPHLRLAAISTLIGEIESHLASNINQ